jgi:hypothetical protein
MRTTLNLDAAILKKAARLTGIRRKTPLVHLGLKLLIAQESSRRLAALASTETSIHSIRRRRPKEHLRVR